MLYALQNDPSGALSELIFQGSMTAGQIAGIRERVIAHRGVAMAEEKAAEYGRDAMTALKKIKKSESRTILEAMMQKIA